MSSLESLPAGYPEPERSAMVGSPERRCVVCGQPRSPRKQAACSDACRAALSRTRRADARRERNAEIRALLEAALEKLREDP
jgi:predicted nucleic acid-binding Zn ribbon protein